MIDFHNHILPNVDDGAKSLEESIQMLQHAQDNGITEVVNTIHFQHPKMEGKNTDFTYVSSVKDDLMEIMYKENIDIKIHLGAEVFFNFNLLDILKYEMVTFSNGKYMLVEFNTFQFPNDFDKHLYELVMFGITPIIAHPERYKPVQKDIRIIEKLINSGCLVQLDAGSILGHFGKNCRDISETMLQKNMVHIIGSDSHSMGRRNFCLKEAIDVSKKIAGKIDVDTIISNPKKVLSGEKIIAPEIIDVDNNSFIKKISKKIFKK